MGIFIADSFSKTTAIFGKVLTDSGWTPVALYFLTLIVVSIFLAVHELIVHGGDAHRWSIGRKDIMGIALTTLMGGVLSPILFFTGMMYSSASEAILVTSLLPFFIVCFAVLLLGERFTKPMILGGALLVAGTLVLVWQDFLLAEIHRGIPLLLGSSVTGALTTTLHKKYISHPHLDSVVFLRVLLSLVTVGIWMLLTERASFGMLLQPQNIWVLFGMSVLGFLLPFFLYFRSLQQVSTMEAGVMVAAGPAVGVLMAAGFLGEQVLPMQLLSLAFAVAGILVINVPLTKKRIMPSRPMELGPLSR